LSAGVRVWMLLLVLLVAHTAVAAYITVVVREFALRFVTFLVATVMYRVHVSGHDHVPRAGPALLVCNHVSYADWFVLAAAIRRPPRFVMHHSFYAMPVVHWLFRQARVIPIASSKEDPALLAAAFERIHEALADGQLVCLFPEGSVTKTGAMIPFRPGMERVVERDRVPVVPMALDGMWGSFFSRKDDAALTKPFRRGVWSRVWVRIGPPVPAPQATALELERQVASLLGVQPPSALSGQPAPGQ
jgi:1-acyl-sn-glycerol-3-phosphate acyltransferase